VLRIGKQNVLLTTVSMTDEVFIAYGEIIYILSE
jgi:hypothetical protein